LRRRINKRAEGAKFIVLAIVCINLMAIIFQFSCSQQQNSCAVISGNNLIFNTFFNIENDPDLSLSGGLGASDGLTDASQQLTEPASGAGGIVGGGISLIIDALKLVLGILSLLTPIPIIAFINSLAIPNYIGWILYASITIMYILGLAEFVVGAKL
jgi:hypothetical protein